MMHEGDDQIDKNLVEMFYELETVIMEMTKADPMERISLINALKKLMALSKKFTDFSDLQRNISIFERLELIVKDRPKKTVETAKLLQEPHKQVAEIVKVYEENYIEKFEILKASKI